MSVPRFRFFRCRISHFSISNFDFTIEMCFFDATIQAWATFVWIPSFGIQELKKFWFPSAVLISGLRTSMPYSRLRHFEFSYRSLDLLAQLSMPQARVWHCSVQISASQFCSAEIQIVTSKITVPKSGLYHRYLQRRIHGAEDQIAVSQSPVPKSKLRVASCGITINKSIFKINIYQQSFK